MTTYCDNCGRETPEHSLVPSDDGMVCARCAREYRDVIDDEIPGEVESLITLLVLRVWRATREEDDPFEGAT
jgi:recombinational DNA repair protein (RecF pathway)